MKELIWIESYYESGTKTMDIAKKLNRSGQTIYNVINFIKDGHTIQNYYDRYKANKSRCGAKKTRFTSEQIEYV